MLAFSNGVRGYMIPIHQAMALLFLGNGEGFFDLAGTQIWNGILGAHLSSK